MTLQMERTVRKSTQVAAAAEALLMASSHLPLRRTFCQYDDGVLVLQGRVKSFFHKQLAQATVANIEGVNQVVNKIEVVDGKI